MLSVLNFLYFKLETESSYDEVLLNISSSRVRVFQCGRAAPDRDGVQRPLQRSDRRTGDGFTELLCLPGKRNYAHILFILP